MNKEQYNKLKEKFISCNQGILIEPTGIDTNEKRPVIVYRVNTGGYSGGNCWDDSKPEYYHGDEDKWVTFSK